MWLASFFIDNIRPMGGAKKVGWAHLLVAGHRAIWGGRGARRHRQGALAGVEASSGRWMDGHFIKHIFVFNKKISCAARTCHVFNHGMLKTFLNSQIWELKMGLTHLNFIFSNSYFPRLQP